MDRLVLLHGSPGAPSSWDRVQGHLDGRAGEAPMLSTTATDLDGQLAVVEPFLEAGPVELVGHSFGGLVALAAAMRWPDRVERLVLLEPVALGSLWFGDDPALAAETFAFFDAYCDQVEDGNHDAISTMIDYWFGDGAFARMPERIQKFLVGSAEVSARHVRSVLAWRPEPEGVAIEVPTTVVIGTLSPPSMIAIGDNLARVMPRATVVSLVGGGHAMADTHPAEIAALIDRPT